MQNTIFNFDSLKLIFYVSSSGFSSDLPVFNFSQLEKLYALHAELDLVPHVELMGNPGKIFSKEIPSKVKNLYWKELIVQFLENFIRIFGVPKINHWRFETWNEPDLATYNRLQWTLQDYLGHIQGIRNGVEEVKRKYEDFSFKLRGPAGLFRKRENHEFCYGILDLCNASQQALCPIDILTFHRKGEEKAKQILEEESELLAELRESYPFLESCPWSNNEADPTTGWSTPLRMNQGFKYAKELVLNVMMHWNASQSNHFKNFESISHDNAFLSYHPHEFSQRTLFARFQMNKTSTKYSEFIQKPVFSALGLLANLGPLSKPVQKKKDLWLWKTKSEDGSFRSLLILSTKSNSKRLKINISNLDKSSSHFVEIIDRKCDPFSVWKQNGSPFYPNQTVFQLIRKAESPRVLHSGRNRTGFHLNLKLSSPFLMLIRICPVKSRRIAIQSINVRQISLKSVMVYWKTSSERQMNCLRGFQVFFRETQTDNWTEVSKGFHVPFNVFQFNTNASVYGQYKVKSMEISNRNQANSASVWFVK